MNKVEDELIDVGKRKKKIFRKWRPNGEQKKFFLVLPYSLWPASKKQAQKIVAECKKLGYLARRDNFGPPDDYAVYAWNKDSPDLPQIAVIPFETSSTRSSKVDGIDPSTQVDKEAPRTVVFVGKRIIRDTQASKDLKVFYDYTCQICETRLSNGRTKKPYSEVHHIRPLGVGPPMVDNWSNMICLCPNHHAEMDYRMMYIDPKSKKIVHSNKNEPANGKKLKIQDGHEINTDFLEYHKMVLCKGWSK
ncbi:MAG: HNH endonuclease [Candidatus Thorarchaeota archaeon]